MDPTRVRWNGWNHTRDTRSIHQRHLSQTFAPLSSEPASRTQGASSSSSSHRPSPQELCPLWQYGGHALAPLSPHIGNNQISFNIKNIVLNENDKWCQLSIYEIRLIFVPILGSNDLTWEENL